MNMDLFEAINRRHSYREGFLDKEIPESDLVKIVQAGIAAPSGRNCQTTDFIIVNKQEIIREIAEIIGYTFLKTARAAVICIIPEPAAVYHGYSFEVEDCAAAVENMLLAVTALGYASVWIDGALRLNERAEKIGQLIHIPQGKKVRIILPVGVPAEKKNQKEKKPFQERAWFNSYPAGD